jgi:hypothetical protein
MQAVELAQHGGDGFSPLFRLATDDEDFNPGAENVGLLLLQRGLPHAARSSAPSRIGSRIWSRFR